MFLRNNEWERVRPLWKSEGSGGRIRRRPWWWWQRWWTVVVVVGSIFRLLYEAILKENASNEKANEEEKNDDVREPFFTLRIYTALQPSHFGTGDFFIFFFIHIATPFLL